MGDEYGIYYRPEIAAERVSSARMSLIVRVGSLVFSGVVIGLLWVLWPESIGAMAPWLLAASLTVSGVLVVLSLIEWLRVAGEAKRASGLAIGLNRDGVLIGERWLTWPEVGSMLVKPGSGGTSSKLVTTARDNSALVVPLELTDAMPASLDSVVRVLSGGRTWVDLSRLD